MGLFAATLKAAAGRDKAWHKYVAKAVDDTNAEAVITTKKSGRGMMRVSPDEAAGATGTNQDIIQFNLKKAAADGYEHGSKTQKRARDQLNADGAFKLMDPIVYEGAEGRRRKSRRIKPLLGRSSTLTAQRAIQALLASRAAM